MKTIYLFLFLICTSTVALCNEQFLSPTSFFNADISIDEASLNTDFYTKVHRFYMNTTVKNTSNQEQKITVWVQYGWNWTSNISEVVPCKEALQNFPISKILKPGQEYSQKMEMCSAPHKILPIRFRLGFFPNPHLPIPESMDIKKSDGIRWSNEVTLNK